MGQTHHEIELLRTRALMIIINYFEGYCTKEENEDSLKQLLRDYRRHNDAIKAALKNAFKYMLKERYIPDPDDPYDDSANEPKVPERIIAETKESILSVLRKVWKK